jgi:hypothetical protein
MDISILRKRPEDRIRTVPLFGSNDETADVLFCGREEMQKISALAERLIAAGDNRDDAFNKAYGRIALIGWKGLADGDEDLSFTEENIDLLMTQSAEFRTAVLTAASSLRGGLEKN